MRYSIIIPVFQCAGTLRECLSSVLALPDSEILLIDDGSTDESGALCDGFARRYPQIRCVHQENAGVSAARNRGLELAKGAYILFLDGDDTLDIRLLTGLPAADLLIFAQNAVLESGWLDWQGELAELFTAGLLCPVWNKVFRRDIVEKHQLRFREELFVYEDLEFVLRYLRCCGSVRLVPGQLCRHRPSQKSRARITRLDSLKQVLSPIGAALPEGSAVLPKLAEILAREKLAASPERMVPILREYRAFCPEGRLLPLLRGAAGLRWRL